MIKKPSIAPVVHKYKLNQQPNDAEYWRSLPPEERIEAVEKIREEFHRWIGHADTGFQRVYSIVKRK